MDLLDKILSESTLYENYQSESLTELQKALKIAEDTVILRIAKTNGTWTRSRLLDIQKLINEQIQLAYAPLNDNLHDEAVKVANSTYGFMLGELGKDVPVGVANELVNGNKLIQMDENNAYTFKDLFKVSEQQNARVLRTLVAAGVNQGRSIDGIIRDYEIKSDRLSKGQIRTNINTYIGQARMDAKESSFKELEKTGVIKGYEYVAVLDSNTTVYCRDHDNRKYYQPIEEIRHLIKVHANCRSEFIPITENQQEAERASQFGTAKGAYEKWYLEQSDEFHQSTLTNKQYNLFLKDKYKVKSLNDITRKQSLENINKTYKNI